MSGSEGSDGVEGDSQPDEDDEGVGDIRSSGDDDDDEGEDGDDLEDSEGEGLGGCDLDQLAIDIFCISGSISFNSLLHMPSIVIKAMNVFVSAYVFTLLSLLHPYR